MAEVALAPETEVTPPEDVALTTPDSQVEQTPESDNQQDETSFVDDILKGLDSESVSTGSEDGKDATTDGQVPVTAPPKTEAEIRQQLEAEQRAQQEAQNLRTYREGVTRSFQNLDSDLTQMAKEWGLDLDQAERLKQRVQHHNGAWNVLYQAAVEQVRPQIQQEAATEMQRQVAMLQYDAIKEELGETAVKALQSGGVNTWQDFTKSVVKEARKGYVPAADYTSKKAVKELLAKYDTALQQRGLSLESLNGTANISLPPPRGGTGAQPKNYAEAEAWHASDKWSTAQFKAYKATHSRE